MSTGIEDGWSRDINSIQSATFGPIPDKVKKTLFTTYKISILIDNFY